VKKGTRNNIILRAAMSLAFFFLFALPILVIIMSDEIKLIETPSIADMPIKTTTRIPKSIIRIPAEHALEDFIIGRVKFKGINEKYIRTGPGMKYKSDDTGCLPERDTLYVLEEKDGWIRFRVTKKNLGWSAWIRKDLTIPIFQF